MSPANIEAALKGAQPADRPGVRASATRGRYNTALIVLDPDFAPAWAAAARHRRTRRSRRSPTTSACARRCRPASTPPTRSSRGSSRSSGSRSCAATGAGRRRAHADDEAQAQADRREVRGRDRGDVRAVSVESSPPPEGCARTGRARARACRAGADDRRARQGGGGVATAVLSRLTALLDVTLSAATWGEMLRSVAAEARRRSGPTARSWRSRRRARASGTPSMALAGEDRGRAAGSGPAAARRAPEGAVATFSGLEGGLRRCWRRRCRGRRAAGGSREPRAWSTSSGTCCGWARTGSPSRSSRRGCATASGTSPARSSARCCLRTAADGRRGAGRALRAGRARRRRRLVRRVRAAGRAARPGGRRRRRPRRRRRRDRRRLRDELRGVRAPGPAIRPASWPRSTRSRPTSGTAPTARSCTRSSIVAAPRCAGRPPATCRRSLVRDGVAGVLESPGGTLLGAQPASPMAAAHRGAARAATGSCSTPTASSRAPASRSTMRSCDLFTRPREPPAGRPRARCATALPRRARGRPRDAAILAVASAEPLVHSTRWLPSASERRRGPDRRRRAGRRADDDQDRDREPGRDDGPDPQGRGRRRGHRARRRAARQGHRGAEDDRGRVADPGHRRHPLQPHARAEGDRRRGALHPPEPRQHRRPGQGRRGRRRGRRRPARRCGSASTPARCPSTCTSSSARTPSRRSSRPRSSSSS